MLVFSIPNNLKTGCKSAQCSRGGTWYSAQLKLLNVRFQGLDVSTRKSAGKKSNNRFNYCKEQAELVILPSFFFFAFSVILITSAAALNLISSVLSDPFTISSNSET